MPSINQSRIQISNIQLYRESINQRQNKKIAQKRVQTIIASHYLSNLKGLVLPLRVTKLAKMDIKDVELFKDVFHQCSRLFLDTFEDTYQKICLLKESEFSKIYEYKHFNSNKTFVVKEIYVTCIEQLPKIRQIIESLFIVNLRISNKLNVLTSPGFFYVICNPPTKQQQNKILQISSYSIKLSLIFEKCDGSLADLQVKSNFISEIPKKNNPQMDTCQNIHLFQNPSFDTELNTIKSNNITHDNSSKRKKPFEFYDQNIQVDFSNLEYNLKNMIVQLHELDGYQLSVQSFQLKDIYYIQNEKGLIDLKFIKVSTFPNDSQNQLKHLSICLLEFSMGKPLTQQKSNQIDKIEFINIPVIDQQPYSKDNQGLSSDDNHPKFSEENHQSPSEDDIQNALSEWIKFLNLKGEESNINVISLCSLLKSIGNGVSINQAYYQLLNSYDSTFSFQNFNKTNIFAKQLLPFSQLCPSFGNSILQFEYSQGKGDQTVVSLECSTLPVFSGKSKTNSIMTNKDNARDHGSQLIAYMTNPSSSTLIQSFVNLVNAFKQKKKKLRFEKYITQNKENIIFVLKLIIPSLE